MNLDTQKEIYNKWQSLKNDSKFVAHNTGSVDIEHMYNLDFENSEEYFKYSKWVLKYCNDLLNPVEKHELQIIVKESILCDCEKSDCKECLAGKCEDIDCYFHMKSE